MARAVVVLVASPLVTVAATLDALRVLLVEAVVARAVVVLVASPLVTVAATLDALRVLLVEAICEVDTAAIPGIQ